MKKTIFLLFTLLLPLIGNSPIDINGYDHQIVYWSFDHQFEKANNLVDEKIEENPNIPKYYFLKIVTLSLQHLADSDNYGFEERYEFRKQKNKELIEYTERALDKFDDLEMTPDNKFYLANMHGYLGRMYSFEGSYMAAFSNAKKGKDALEELVEEHPEFYDAYLLLGMFEYYADRLSGVTKFITSILGFSGDRSTGLQYLKIAQQKGELTKPFAEFILGETYTFQESNNFDAVRYFETLIRRYKNNSSFYDWYVRLLIQLDRLKDAEQAITNDVKNHVWGYTKGIFYFKNAEYQKTIDSLSAAIESKSFKWRGAFAQAKFLVAVSSLLLDKPIDGIESELSEDRLTIYNEVKNNKSAALKVHQFAAEVGRMNIGEEMELPKITELPPNGYLRAMYEFYSGVYFYKYRDATRAILFFSKVGSDREHFRSQSAEYLINIYKSVKPTEEQLDQLEDIIDDIDNDDLQFAFMDLRR